MFNYENRRCVDEAACRKIAVQTPFGFENSLPDQPYIPFNETCTYDCPSGFYPDGESGNRVCKRCEGVCKKVCSSRLIDSISAAQSCRGCTHITGGIIIQINSKAGRK